MNGHAEEDVSASIEHVFDQFVTAVTCKSILTSFNQLLDLTGLRHASHVHFYEKLKAKLKGSWKAQNLWAKLDKRASHRDYMKGQACSNKRVLIIGSGPCGLRTAIECALLGAKTVVVEKRDRFSRNNVLHLWPYLITDLRNLGAKKFFGKFCAGAIDHISIRQLQCILLKVALLLGVEVHVSVTFEGLIEPPEDQNSGIGWKCRVSPETDAVSEYQFDVLIGADGKRNTLSGFKRKEFRGKLAIAVTANFINRNTQAEARVQEISGVAFIFNQKFFLDLKESTRIDLENIVYYKDDTHYFVMTAKKASLLEKGVLKEDYSDTIALLDRSNVDQERLIAFAREAADFSTNYQLPSLDYAVNHYGQADVAMFDFTSMFAAENASRFVLKNGHHLLMGLVGDSLIEPFWPTGSGCARGFLSAFDAAWMIRSWALGKTPLQVLAERESIYTILSQTTSGSLNKNHNLFSLDPNTRYANVNLKTVKPSQVRHLYEGGVFDSKELEEEDLAATVPAKRPRNADISAIDSYSLLRWCQRVLNTGLNRDVHVVDFTSSWRSGLALCALIHSFRPEIINNRNLMECDVVANNQLAFDIAEKELGIPPVLTGEDMAKYEVPDKLTMVSYLAQFYDLFKNDPLACSIPLPPRDKHKNLAKTVSNQPKSPHSPNKRASFLQKLSAKLAKSKKKKEHEENERSILGSQMVKEKKEKEAVELIHYNKLPMNEIANRLQLDRKIDIKVNKTEERSGAVSVTAMADLLVAKFKSHESRPPPEPIRRLKGQPSLLAASAASEFCTFCHKRVYLMERMSAEGEFFHRGCLKCDHCGVGLRLTNYSCDRDSKPVKFYCYRHAIPEQRTRPQRKRGLEEDVKENLPDVVVTPPTDMDTDQEPKEKTPRKAATIPLTPLLLPKNISGKGENTPERVEFEISFDGQEEESEEEQFEHNLRASLSSDALLDDEDSDSELSDSDIESGAEDEVWENAAESFKSPLAPLTLEEAFELRGSWRRQHSQENLIDAVEEDRTPSRGPEYSRLHGDNGEEEDTSTEIEEGSEYETDYSSEEDSEEDKTEPAQGAPADSQTETSLKSPISPVSRLSASKASFFSQPPKVVSLDPWSMFGMGKKAGEQEMEVPKNATEGDLKGRQSSSPSKKKSSTSESSSVSERKKSTDSKKDTSSKDTDISESLEFDVKSSDVFLAKDEKMSSTDSIDELKEDLDMDTSEDLQPPSQDVNNEDIGEAHRTQHVTHVLEERLEVSDLEKGNESDVDEDVDADELLEKTALSHAMEQLLHDIDHKNVSDYLNTESSDSDDNMFLERRLSLDKNKIKMHNAESHEKLNKDQKISRSVISDSEAATRTKQKLNPSVNRSHSAEQADELLQYDKNGDLAFASSSSVKSGSSNENCELTSQADLEAAGSLQVDTHGDDESLRQILENVAAMPDLSENSDIDDIVFSNIDDRFVTDRCKRSTKVSGLKRKKKRHQKSGNNDLDFSRQRDLPRNIPVSSGSDTEISSSSFGDHDFKGESLEIVSGDDDIKPDPDMLKDYTTTLSLALGESYSDEAEEKLPEGEDGGADTDVHKNTKNRVDQKLLPDSYVCNNNFTERRSVIEDTETNANENSLYVTPDVSMDKQENSVAETPVPVSPSSSLPRSQSQVPVPQPRKSIMEAVTTKESTSASTQVTPSTLTPHHNEGNRDSMESEIFYSPVESTLESPLVKKQSSTQAPSEVIEPSFVKVSNNTSGKTRTTSPLPSSAVNEHPVNSEVKDNLTADKRHKKLPELPKLHIPTKEFQQSSKEIEDQPVMCSSPKAAQFTPTSSSSNINQQNHVLPVPTTRSKISTDKVSSSASSASQQNKSNGFVKPASPPAFRPLPKLKVPIDKCKLKLGSSSDHLESDHEADTKKRISAQGIVIKDTFDDDIPFADESEAEDKFYTPCAAEQKGKPIFQALSSDQSDGRKKILPVNLQKTKDTRETGIQKSKAQAQEISESYADGMFVTLDLNSTDSGLKRHSNGESVNIVSYDTNSTSDVLSDSDDNKVDNAVSSATEGDQASGKKTKVRTHKTKKERKEITEKTIAAKDTKSLHFRPEDTPKRSGVGLKLEAKEKISKFSSPNEKKTRTFKIVSDSCVHSDNTPVSVNKKNLAICSVFHTEATKKGPKEQFGNSGTRKAMSLVPRASADELSDSDESHISLSTMQKRRDEDLDERVARRLRKIQQKQQKRAEQKRLRMAQEIQRQLEEVEVRQKELEERGIAVEKALRGDAPDGEDVDENQLMSEWFTLVHEKNALLRYEAELNVRAKELELEDRQARLEMDFRERSKQPEEAKTESDIAAEGHLLDELLEVVEQRNNLVAMLEEDRLREQLEDSDLKAMMAQKGFVLSPLSFDTRKKIEAPLATHVL